METHPRKRLDIIVEAPMQRRVVELLEAEGVSGYTVLPCLAGRGHEGSWQQGDISNAFTMRLIMVVAEEALARRVMARVYDLLSDYIAIVTLCDVEVIRADHF